MSARLFSHVTFGLTLMAILAVPVTALEAPAPQTPATAGPDAAAHGAKPVDEAAAAVARTAGLEVVMDRCILKDHRSSMR